MALANCTEEYGVRRWETTVSPHCQVFTLDLSLLFFFFLGFVDFRGRVANLKWVLKTKERVCNFLQLGATVVKLTGKWSILELTGKILRENPFTMPWRCARACTHRHTRSLTHWRDIQNKRIPLRLASGDRNMLPGSLPGEPVAEPSAHGRKYQAEIPTAKRGERKGG